ncbi:MAG: cardiolipin synthase, partial [Bacteroides sp.]|nr:cardiolipin synthase [Bacteroides sp.]
YIVLAIKLIYNIILKYDNCNPVKTVGWILAIVFLPVLGILIYITAERNLRKKSSQYEQLQKQTDIKSKQKYGFNFDEDCDLTESHSELKCLLTHVGHQPVFPYNDVQLFMWGEQKFESMFKDMEEAKDHIHIVYYTISDDELGTMFKDILLRKAKEGVTVRVIYDDIGSEKTHKRYFKELEEGGVILAPFTPYIFKKILYRINYRNHKKIVVIDGRIAYTGGFNVMNMYVKGVEWGVWRDAHVRIEGSGAQGLQSVFLLDWYFTHQEFVFEDRYFPVIGKCGNSILQVATSEPLGEHRVIMQGMFEAIVRAKKSIYIENPYFVPTDSILTALQVTAMSGVEIHFVMPLRSDNRKVQYASNSYVEQLLCSNIHVYQYGEGFIHSKMMVIDDEIVIVGSSNMDIRSFDLNFECSVFIYDKELAAQVKGAIINDMEDSVKITPEGWNKRNEKWRFRDAFFRLFSPFL